MISTLVPIIKDKVGDITSSDNYRSIAINCLILNVFDYVILDIHGDKLTTDELQFGYQDDISTRTVYMCACACVDVYARMYVCVSVYVCVYVCMRPSIFGYIFICMRISSFSMYPPLPLRIFLLTIFHHLHFGLSIACDRLLC